MTEGARDKKRIERDKGTKPVCLSVCLAASVREEKTWFFKEREKKN